MEKKVFFLKIGAGILLAGAFFSVIFWEREPTTAQSSPTPVYIREDSKNFPVSRLIRLDTGKNNTPDYSEFSHAVQQGLAKIKNVLPVHLEEKMSKEMPPLLSEREIHDRIWPPHYIEGLRGIEKLLIEEGFIAQEKRNAFARDQDMYDFLLMLTEYAYAKEWITDEELRNFTRGIREVLRETIEREKAAMRQTGTFGAVLPKDQFFAESKPHIALIRDIIDGLSHMLSLIEPANAAWVRGADCYKDDNPLYPVPGPNLAAFCCNCGFKLDICGTRCCAKFKDDCGPNNRDCIGTCGTIPLGCLNFTCITWPNAIWDNKDTGICGCG